MPPTRRTSQVKTPPRKLNAAVVEEKKQPRQLKKTQSEQEERPERAKSRQSTESATSSSTNSAQRCDKTPTVTVGEGDGSARRSSRQRTVSKRLQDMEVYYVAKKPQAKRANDDTTLEVTPMKRIKADTPVKSITKTRIAPEIESAEDDVVEDVSPIVEVSDKSEASTGSEASDDDAAGNDVETSPAVVDTDESDDEEVGAAETSNQQESMATSSTGIVTTEHDSSPASDNDTNTQTTDDDNINNGAAYSKDTTSSIIAKATNLILNTQKVNTEHAYESSGALQQQEENKSDIKTTNQSSHNIVAETVKQLEELKQESVCEETHEDMLEVDDGGGNVGEEENAIVYVDEDNTYKVANVSQIIDSKSESVIIVMNPEDGSAQLLDQSKLATNLIPVSEANVKSMVEMGSTSEAVSKTMAGATIVSTSLTEGGTIVDGAPQFVVLDDGRQLLLSNADALATAADAVASLGQMKEVQFIISQDNTVVTAPMIASNVDASQKIKFVTVNASTDCPTKLHEFEMRMSQDGQITAAPATILSPDGFYRCSMCSYKTDKKANWYKHRYVHMAQRRYQCEQCDHRATTSSNLKRHMLIHTDTKLFTCHCCDAGFRQKIHLARHIKYKHVKKTVKCAQCDYVCANVTPDLLAHIKRKHNCENESSIHCETCGFIAANSRDLKQHLKFHRKGPELKLYCEHCSFVTDCASRLKRHELVHNRQRPFWCALCSYKGSQKEHVLRHLRTKHNMKPTCAIYENIEEIDNVVINTLVPAETIITHAEMDQETSQIVEEAAAQVESARIESAKNESAKNESAKNELAKGGSALRFEPTPPVSTITKSAISESTQNDSAKFESAPDESSPSTKCHKEDNHQEQSASSEPVSDSDEESAQVDTQVTEDQEKTKGQSATEPIQPTLQVVTSTGGSIGNEADPIQSPPSKVVPNRRLRHIIYQSQLPKQAKKKYPPADFSSKEKVFSCIHCTMKFAKLINLYKHLSVQHKDLQPTRSDGLHTCVWCEYQTNKWKNLLVHMRKHNYREEYGMMATRYACVVCTYSSQHRKALYAHMMKKHKIQIYVKPDGSASCVIDDTIPGAVSGTDGKSVVVERPAGEVSATGGVVLAQSHQLQDKEQALGKQATLGNPPTQEQSPGAQPHTQTVMIELEPGMPATAVEIMAPGPTTCGNHDDVDHEAADAIEGLQALAEQVMAVQQEQALEDGEVPIDTAFEKTDTDDSAARDNTDQLQAEGGAEDETQIHIQDSSGQTMEAQNIQLTPEQLMQLTSGDFIEINGEMYKVEVAEDAMAPEQEHDQPAT